MAHKIVTYPMSIRLPGDLLDQMKDWSVKLRRPVAFLGMLAIEEWLERQAAATVDHPTAPGKPASQAALEPKPVPRAPPAPATTIINVSKSAQFGLKAFDLAITKHGHETTVDGRRVIVITKDHWRSAYRELRPHQKAASQRGGFIVTSNATMAAALVSQDEHGNLYRLV